MHHKFHSGLYASTVLELFTSGSDKPINGLSQLSPFIRLNDQTVAAEFVYTGNNATADELSGTLIDGVRYGEPLEHTGQPVVLNQPTPFISEDKSFDGSDAGGFVALTSSVGDINGDFVLEFVGNLKGDLDIVNKRSGANEGWIFRANSLNGGFFLEDDTGLAIGNGNLGLGGVAPTGWFHLLVVNDKDFAGNGLRFYVNGVDGPTPSNTSTLGDTSSGNKLLFIGNSDIAWVALWKKDDWLDGSDNASWEALAQERFYKLTGTYPKKTVSDPIAIEHTRSSVAYLDKLSGSVRQLYKVRDNWQRVCYRKDKNGQDIVGLLSEPTTQNLFLSASDLTDGSTWTHNNSSVSASSVPSPDVDSDMFAWYASDTASNQHTLTQQVQPSSGRATLSCFVSASAVDNVILEPIVAFANPSASFDLTNGTIGNISSTVSGTFIEDYGNGIYRCGLAWDHDGTLDQMRIYASPDGTTLSYAASDVAEPELYIWAPQVASEEHPSSWIPTFGSAATRSRDDIVFSLNSGSLGRGGTVSCKVLFSDFDESQGRAIVEISAESSPGNNLIRFARQSDRLNLYVTSGSVVQVNTTDFTANISNGELREIDVTWKEDDFKLFLDDTLELSDTAAGTPKVLERITLLSLDGLISNLKLYNKPTQKK